MQAIELARGLGDGPMLLKLLSNRGAARVMQLQPRSALADCEAALQVRPTQTQGSYFEYSTQFQAN